MYMSFNILPGEKLVQFLLVPVIYADPAACEFEHLYDEITSRGAGGFGSTDITGPR